MNIAERHVAAYAIGCLTGEFGEGRLNTFALLQNLRIKTKNPLLRQIVKAVRSGHPEHPDTQKAVRGLIEKACTKLPNSQ